MITKAVFAFVLVALSSVCRAETFAPGATVDAEQNGVFYKAKVKSASTCYEVAYDDGSSGTVDKSSVSTAGSKGAGTAGVKGQGGEKIDAKWTNGAWYGATIKASAPCYLIEWTGWPDYKPEWLGADKVFKKDSKVKGDTSAAAMGAKGGGGGAATKAQPSAADIAECSGVGKDRNGCMRRPKCEWRDDRCGIRQ